MNEKIEEGYRSPLFMKALSGPKHKTCYLKRSSLGENEETMLNAISRKVAFKMAFSIMECDNLKIECLQAWFGL